MQAIQSYFIIVEIIKGRIISSIYNVQTVYQTRISVTGLLMK